MGDSDDTPPGRPRRRAQTATERDLEGMRARGERAERQAAAGASLESERTRQQRERKAGRTHPHGVPLQPMPDMVERELSGTVEVPLEMEGPERSKPWEVLDSDLLPEEQEIVQRSKRPSGSPLLLEDGAKILLRLERALDVHAAETQRANAHLAALNTTPSGKLAGRVGKIEKRTSSWTWVLRGLTLLIAGGLLTFLDRFWDRSAHETEIRIGLENAKETIKEQGLELKSQGVTIQYLQRRLDALAAPTWPHQQHNNKDPQP